jgi:beta-galactosidase
MAVAGILPRSFTRGFFLTLFVIAQLALNSCGTGVSPAALAPTLSFRPVDGGRVAMQSGQPVPGFGFQPDRQRLDLASGWRFQPAVLNEPLSFEPRKAALTALEQEAAGRQGFAFDDGSWRAIAVPGSVDAPPGKSESDGWYRVTFSVPPGWSSRQVSIKFGSVNYLADVWLNGTYLGYHEGGTTPFALDPGKALLIGVPNALAVRVIDPRLGSRVDILPWGLSDWWDYAGITGPVWLEAANPAHVVRADVVPHLDAADLSVVVQNSGDVAIDNASLSVQVLPAAVKESNLLNANPLSLVPPEADPIATLAIDSMSISAHSVLERGESFVFRAPDLWSLQRPALYVLAVYLTANGDVLDSFYDTFGLRRIQVDPNNPRLLLNGTPTAFTGVAVHDEQVWPALNGEPHGGTPMSAVDQLRLVRQAQAVNADLLRTNHMPGNPGLLMLADRLGLGVWEEIPLYHATPMSFSLVLQRGIAQQMLAEMDLRDFNRPSVMFHGFANESTGTGERLSAMQTLHDLDRSIDGTRLTGQAMYGSDPADPTSAPLDVAGYTFYYGVFYGGPRPEPGTSRALALAHQTYPHKPVMILEFGDWVYASGTDQQQVNVFKGTYPYVAAHFDTQEGGYVGSAVWWSLEDYWTEVPGLSVEHFGLYRPDGSARSVAAAVRTGFGEVTLPAPPVVGIVSGGKGVPAPAPEPSNFVLHLVYAVAIPCLLLVAITTALLRLRRSRIARRRIGTEAST